MKVKRAACLLIVLLMMEVLNPSDAQVWLGRSRGQGLGRGRGRGVSRGSGLSRVLGVALAGIAAAATAGVVTDALARSSRRRTVYPDPNVYADPYYLEEPYYPQDPYPVVPVRRRRVRQPSRLRTKSTISDYPYWL